jgi:hypothetical protein
LYRDNTKDNQKVDRQLSYDHQKVDRQLSYMKMYIKLESELKRLVRLEQREKYSRHKSGAAFERVRIQKQLNALKCEIDRKANEDKIRIDAELTNNLKDEEWGVF